MNGFPQYKKLYGGKKNCFCNQRMWKDSNKNGHSVSFFLFGYPGDLWPFNRFYWNRLNFFHRENKQVPRICGSWSCILQSFLVFSWAGTCLHTKYSCFQSLQVNTQNVIYWILWHFWFTKRKNCESLWLKSPFSCLSSSRNSWIPCFNQKQRVHWQILLDQGFSRLQHMQPEFLHRPRTCAWRGLTKGL